MMDDVEPAPRARLTATFQPALNAALWQNHVPVLADLSLMNLSEATLEEVTIDLACEPAVIRPRSWHVQQLGPGSIQADLDRDVQLDGAMLESLTEAVRGSVTLTARCAGTVVAQCQQDVRVLAHNQWGGTAGLPDILAAFVQPNDPAVARIARDASDLLRASGKPDSLEGYQGSKARVWDQAQAIWGAVCRLDLRYINPPPSFVGHGQRIRSPHQVVEERLGTCLDLTVLFAACLEFVGLRPLIVLQQAHAFAGLWLSEGDFGTSTVDDAPGLRTRLKLDDLLLFETTSATHAHKPGFSQTLAAGAEHLAPEHDARFEGLIDIHRARQRRILPLAAVVTGTAPQAEREPATPPPMETPPPLRDDIATRPEPPPATPEDRLARWRKRLLDLSGRNRLLNLPATGKTALFVDCPDLARLEDRLAAMRGKSRGAGLKFRPWPELMQGADPRSATVFRQRLHEDAGAAFAREALERGELLVGRDDAALQLSLTEIYRKARADQQEGGSNTLFLTIGSLLWRQRDRETPYRAPLILVPVVLERPSVRSGFVLRVHDDETQLNATLLEMLRQEYAIGFPELQRERPPEDEAGFDVARILDIFRRKLRDIPGWEVRDEVALTTLSFTKFLMWKDLSERAAVLRGNAVVRRLMDGPAGAALAGSSGGRQPAMGGQAGERLGGQADDRLGAADLVCPLEADSSQLEAVARAASGDSFVLIGPPGTGKSQTIANIIADTLARGRTVLFVAEKRAALEVVQRRMKQVGLADFCLDLFSSKASKMAVLEQLDRAQRSPEALDGDAWARTTDNVAALCRELNEYVRELHRPARNGWTPFRAIGSVMRAEDGGVPEIAFAWPSADHHDADGYQRLTEATEEARAILGRAGDIVRTPVLAGITRADWSPVWQVRLLDAAGVAVQRLRSLAIAADAAAAAVGLPASPRSWSGLRALCELAPTLLDPLADQSGWAWAEDAALVHDALRADAARALRHRALAAMGQIHGGPELMALDLHGLRAEWRAAGGKWALARTLGQRRVRGRLAAAAAAPVPDDCGPELDRLIELQDIERWLDQPPHARALGRAWRGLDTEFSQLERGFAWAERLRANLAALAGDAAALLSMRASLRPLVTETADLLRPEGAVGAALTAYLRAWHDAEAALREAATLSGSDDIGAIGDSEQADWLAAAVARLSGWAGAARQIQDWCAWRGVAQQAETLGLGGLVRALEDGLVAPADAVRALEANYARWWVNLAVDASPRLRGFVAARHETRIERFRALDAQMLELAAALVRARVAAGLPGAPQRQHDPEYAVLTRELAKRQRHLPLRQLSLKMPHALRRLTPCLMMSPLSVAQYLPAEAAAFDLVIFDEASQIATWDAIGAVGRGRQVIIVGDPRQLPPTSFFERRSGEDDDAAVEVETHDLDSILDECLGAGVPTIELTWHYRSRHESLIAFSNHTYYGGRLVTFPSPVTHDRAVSFRYVPDGVYARGGARTNLAEARAVVAAALEELRAPAPRSLGIVSFNAEQQSLIEDLLDRARRDDPTLERFFADDAAEPVLVKNLEGIQGEERDVMLFSLTYGPDATGRIGLNFGPLNLAGGERRLNVAVTRAREQLIVFGSVRAEQLDLARSGAVGVAHLKQFLSFAEHGARAFATAASASLGDYESPFEAQVAERLRRKGWVVRSQIGVSGFRIDLAVVDAEASGAYLAGVECDGATYHRGATARDRDRLRQQVLEALGWRVLRIWSTDWWTNADRETDRLHQALTVAQQQARDGRAARDALPMAIAASVPPTWEQQAFKPGVAADASQFYEADYRDRLALIVADLLMRMAPLREDRLVREVARLHGFQRAGRDIRDRVLSVLPADISRTTETVGDFVWPPSVDPAAWQGFRHPVAGDAIDPSDIPLQELIELARSCVARGASDETLLIAMRDACGLKRTGDASRNRYAEAIRLMRATV